ncbi:MAG: hypothetical protein WCD45_05475 [Gallionella sp.]
MAEKLRASGLHFNIYAAMIKARVRNFVYQSLDELPCKNYWVLN